MLKHLNVLNARHTDTEMFTSDARIVYLQKVNKDGNTSKSIIINVVIDIPTHIPTRHLNFSIFFRTYITVVKEVTYVNKPNSLYYS